MFGPIYSIISCIMFYNINIIFSSIWFKKLNVILMKYSFIDNTYIVTYNAKSNKCIGIKPL